MNVVCFVVNKGCDPECSCKDMEVETSYVKEFTYDRNHEIVTFKNIVDGKKLVISIMMTTIKSP